MNVKAAAPLVVLLFVLSFALNVQLGGAAEPSEQRFLVVLDMLPQVKQGRTLAVNAAQLRQEQQQFLQNAQLQIGRFPTPRHQYNMLLNGFTLLLTPDEARQLSLLDGVTAVFPDQVHTPQSDAGPTWVNAPDVWAGTGSLPQTMGEGIVIGIFDTGINFDHPSFAAVGGDGYTHQNPLGSGTFLGHCATDSATYQCNDKLIGAYSWPDSDDDPRRGRHGSHVASIAAGNVVTLTYTMPTITLSPTFSGVAPHANLIVYDVCIGEVSCPTSVILAALEQAMQDGVDVINYSLAGPASDPWQDPIAQAMLQLREAGIFVAVAAGNAGTVGGGTVLAPANAPWVTTAGNSTHHANLSNALVNLSGGDTALPSLGVGASVTSDYGPANIVYAAGIVNSDGEPDNGRCVAGFPPNTFSGEIVFCDSSISQDDVSLMAKAQSILSAGGGGFVTTNNRTTLQRLGINRLSLPGLELRKADADALRTWLSSGSNHMATISGTTREENAAYGDLLYYTSSLGPAPFAADVLKPNVVAPGAKVWAANWTSETPTEPELAFYAGTSQASPHVAGAAALLMSLHSGWTPAQIESALMLTSQTAVFQPDETTPATSLDRGAGRIDIAAAAQTGLLLDESANNFAAANPAFGSRTSQLNLASLTDATCVGSCSWTRTLHNPLAEPTSWMASSSGLSLTVQPNSFTIPPGGSQQISVTANVSGLPQDVWAFGELTLTETTAVSPPPVHFPVTVLPKDINGVWNIPTRRASGLASWFDLNLSAETGMIVQNTVFAAPTTVQLNLPSQTVGTDPYANLGIQTILARTVPAGTAGFWVTLHHDSTARLQLHVGLDDGDGVPEVGEEICSAVGTAVYCAEPSPIAGTYWIMPVNEGTQALTAQMETAVVPNTPANTVSLDNATLSLTWDEPLMAVGERQVSWATIGSSVATPDDLAALPILLERFADDVSLSVSSVDTHIFYEITIAENVRPVELLYSLTVTVDLLGETVQEESWLVPVEAAGAAVQVEGSYTAVFCGEPVTVTLEHITDNVGDKAVTLVETIPIACKQTFLPIVLRQ